MDEQLWLSCEDPRKRVQWLRGTATDRQLRLFSCAFWRRWWYPEPKAEADDEFDRDVIHLLAFAEEWAEIGQRPPGNLPGEYGFGWHPLVARDAYDSANWTIRETTGSKARMDCLRKDARDPVQASEEQGRLLNDIFGNLIRPVTIAHSWQSPTVVALAQAAYAERFLPTGSLDSARLAILADSLEDAGCDDVEILSHLRGSGPHCRGCWVLDALSGRS